MEIAPWTAPVGHRTERFRSLSLDRPRPMPRAAPQGQHARDLPYYDSWVPHPGTGITPAALLTAFRQAELGYPQLQVDILKDLFESDGTARNLFEHRERVVAKATPSVNPGDASSLGQVSAHALQFALFRLPLKTSFEHLLRATREGYSGVEVDWGYLEIEGRRWCVPIYLTPVPARRFRIGTHGMIPVPRYPDGTPTGETTVRLDDLRLYQQIEVPQGHPLATGKWLTLRRQQSEVARSGLGRTAALYAMAKRFSFRDWIVLSERYGIPWPIVSYKEQTDEATLEAAREIIQQIGSDGGAVVSSDLTLDIKEGVKANKPMQGALIAFCNSEMSKLINGSTLRNDNASGGGSSYALGGIHDAVAWDEVRSDGEMLSEALTLQLAGAFHQFNALTCAPPTITMMVEPDLGPAEFMSLAVKAKNELGVDVSQKQLRERCGLRMPLDEADKAPGMQVDAFPTPAGGPP